MTRYLVSLVLVLASFASAGGQGVLFPEAPAPLPQANAVVKLAADQLYVVRSPTECVVIGSPEGFVKVTAETGPIKVRAKFTDSTGWVTKTFTEKHVYLVEASASGRCELLVVSGNTVIRKTLEVSGLPAPPPGPGPPDPVVPDDAFTASLKAAYAKDRDADKAATVAFLAALYPAVAKMIDDFDTPKEWMDKLKAAQRAAKIPDTSISNIRDAISVEWNALRDAGALPKNQNQKLDVTTRAQLVAQSLRTAAALEKLK